MAIFPEYAMPKYKSPIRITKPYIKPNYLADAIIGGIGAYTNMQGMNLKKQMFMAQMAERQRKIQEQKDMQAAAVNALRQESMSVNPQSTTWDLGLDYGDNMMEQPPATTVTNPTFAAIANFHETGMPIGQATQLAQLLHRSKQQSFIDPTQYASRVGAIDNRAHPWGKRLAEHLLPVLEDEVFTQDYVPDTRAGWKKLFAGDADEDTQAEDAYVAGIRNQIGDAAMGIASKYRLDNQTLMSVRAKLSDIIKKYKQAGPLKQETVQKILTDFDESMAKGDLSLNPPPAQVLEYLRRKQDKR